MSDLIDQSTLDADLEAIQERSASLPWYRRPRKLRRQVTAALALTALTAVVLFGGLSYYASDDLLRQGANDQLNSVAESRSVRIESGTNRLLSQVAVLAADLGIVEALADFDTAFDELDEPLSPPQQLRLDEFYDERVVEPINSSGLATIDTDDLQPTSDAGRWVQYHHVVPDTGTDPSQYGATMEANDPFLTSMTDAIGVSDLLLISAADLEVVYSSANDIDLGTNLVNGAFADSVLGRLITDDLGRVRSGRGVFSDFELYLPGGGEPALFAAAAVRDGTEIIGAVAIKVPVAGINAITTERMNWDSMGLDGGESYVVSDQLILQSVSREWIEDPESYLEAVEDPEERRLIEIFGSPVGIQTVDTEAVREAFLGEQFSGRTTNYLGQDTYTSATLIDVPGADWVAVTDVPVERARQPVNDFLRQMLIVGLIVIPIAGLIGFWIARLLSRPIGPSVAAASAVADGERHLDLPPHGNDEFGDLGRRLTRMAAALELQESALSDEFDRKRNMMLSVLPPHLVDDNGVVAGTGNTIDIATAISVTIDSDELDLDPDELSELLAGLSSISNRLVDEHGLERIRVAADRGLFLAGVGVDDEGARTAVDFVRSVLTELDAVAEATGVSAPVHVGISTGPVATGVLSSGSLTFGAWGEPVRRALAIGAMSSAGQVLFDATTFNELDAPEQLAPVDGLIDLDGEPMVVYSLVSTTPSNDG